MPPVPELPIALAGPRPLHPSLYCSRVPSRSGGWSLASERPRQPPRTVGARQRAFHLNLSIDPIPGCATAGGPGDADTAGSIGAMRKLYIAAATYLGLGLAAGVFYREWTRFHDAVESSQLNTLHTHLLTLGTFFFLIALALEKLFALSAHKNFNLWFVLHNVALVWTIGFMVANGLVHTMGNGDSWGAAQSGIAGLGHILLTATFVMFFVILGKRIRRVEYDAAKTRRPDEAAAA